MRTCSYTEVCTQRSFYTHTRWRERTLRLGRTCIVAVWILLLPLPDDLPFVFPLPSVKSLLPSSDVAARSSLKVMLGGSAVGHCSLTVAGSDMLPSNKWMHWMHCPHVERQPFSVMPLPTLNLVLRLIFVFAPSFLDSIRDPFAITPWKCRICHPGLLVHGIGWKALLHRWHTRNSAESWNYLIIQHELFRRKHAFYSSFSLVYSNGPWPPNWMVATKGLYCNGSSSRLPMHFCKVAAWCYCIRFVTTRFSHIARLMNG